jgi:Starch binding domain
MLERPADLQAESRLTNTHRDHIDWIYAYAVRRLKRDLVSERPGQRRFAFLQTMSDNGLGSPTSDARNVEVKFVVPYKTEWGENLRLLGSRGLLGAGDVGRAVPMHCVQGHQGLAWVASVPLPPGYECTYQYVVFHEHQGKVVACEDSHHTLEVPRSAAGSCIMLSDQFQVCQAIALSHRMVTACVHAFGLCLFL